MFSRILFITFFILSHQFLQAQGKLADYKRANSFYERTKDKVYHVPTSITWNAEGNKFWYEKRETQGRSFVLVDVQSKSKETLFAVEELTIALSKSLGRKVQAWEINSHQFYDLKGDSLKFRFANNHWIWERSLQDLYKKDTIQNRSRGYWGSKSQHLEGRLVDSPDKKWKATIKKYNVYLIDTTGKEEQLTFDGDSLQYYSANIIWSPNSENISTTMVKAAPIRKLTLIESSPQSQIQPILHTRDYVKPGDTLAQHYPCIYNLSSKQLIKSDSSLITNQYEVHSLVWRKDNSAILFDYNKRGHQQYAIVELHAVTGETRYIINEESKTFIDYYGKRIRRDIAGGKEIIWSSERDGWHHLFLYDGIKGKVKNQITKGEWVVRKVNHVDAEKRIIIFEASGVNKEIDPYLIKYYTIQFDGKNLKEISPEDANHEAVFNKDHTYFVDLYSKVDQEPISVLRNQEGRIVMELEKGDVQALKNTGWNFPEVFTAKGRDGVTDIWGIIVRPSNFDPNKSYPIIENIYAGPHSSFVPKKFSTNPSWMQELAELGFIVVKIDGMGTSNRSKSFHDVCWQDLKDAGFPDRILWIKAAAQKYPYMNIDKVGIYGTSAGGQSATGALLFHSDFYKVAVSSCGCHDNRMDKIWWNEQWMGYPIGSHYDASSNVVNAGNLKGDLMLIVGEMDDNVDPSSTYQLVDALIKAKKNHEFIMVPGMGHSSGGDYGERKRRDFFVKNLLGVNPPNWDEYK